MINPANDTLLTFGEAARRCPRVNGRPVSATTVWRWARRGLRGVRLEHVFIGRRACTTTAALIKFFNEVAQAQQLPWTPRPAPTDMPRPRVSDSLHRRQIAAAEARLKAKGTE